MKTKQVVRELLAVYKESSEKHLISKGDINRIKFVRPSQLPICPVGVFISAATFGALRMTDMVSSFYMEVGTAVHSVVQKYLGTSGRFLATWQCRQCGKRHELTTRHECCDFDMDYHEISINHKGVIGHIDAVFQDSEGRYWIVDFKTSSVKGIIYKEKNPGPVYKAQVRAYALMLWLQYGIRVAGVMLMFIKRDNPTEPKVWIKEMDDDDFAKAKKEMKGYKRMLKEVLAVATANEAIALARYGRCKNPYCRTCKLDISLKTQIRKAYQKGKEAHRLPLSELQ
jgi:CRISPR/Cas system-associated exonuclease Cas4 (RecB family)